ncbi:MAG: hypothetical protein KAX38_03865 [Candidatus Krumholzibacteria bacterium]|nr:hypothetical protein [Candidatus Krumholzibacteria bacterium]
MTILKLFTVLFIVTAALDKSRDGKATWIFALALIVASAAIHHFRDGFNGFLFFISGVTAAFVLTFVLYRLKHITLTELVISCAIGGILGPAGYSIAFIIAFSLLTIQHLLKADKLPLSNRLFFNNVNGRSSSLIRDEKSALAEIEAKKILRNDDNGFERYGCPDIRPGPGSEDADGCPCREMLPWRAKMALAVIAVLMIGIP